MLEIIIMSCVLSNNELNDENIKQIIFAKSDFTFVDLLFIFWCVWISSY